MGVRMEKYNRQRLKNIQEIFEERTGVNVATKKSESFCVGKKVVAVAGVMVCFLTLSAFAYSKFSSIAGDEVGFAPVYMGDGVFEITISNLSDRDLKLQEQIKLMQWSSAEEVQGDRNKVVFENSKIEAHSESKVIVDLSEGYDIAELEKPLDSGDWYYLVLTNNNFAFGQDWMCGIDFSESVSEAVTYNPVLEEKPEEVIHLMELKFEEWVWPTVSDKISVLYGKEMNGIVTDHINISGNKGDEVYAVADGKVLQAEYDTGYGYCILIELQDGITVKYGHLKEILVESGEEVSRGQKIAELGSSGMATGPNLFFAVYENGKAIDPLNLLAE